MAADTSNDDISDTNKQINRQPIQEDELEDAIVKGDEMDKEAEELTEKVNLMKSHIIVRFNGNGQKTNVTFLRKEVFKWLNDIDPEMYFTTDNPHWKTIKNLADFPMQESDFLKCFAPSNA
jgi:hypothetical protein